MPERADELERWATRDIEWHWHKCPVCRSKWECQEPECEDDLRRICPPCASEARCHSERNPAPGFSRRFVTRAG